MPSPIKTVAKMPPKMAAAAPPLHENGCQDGDRSSTASAPKMAAKMAFLT
jgi:hypothetical protein